MSHTSTGSQGLRYVGPWCYWVTGPWKSTGHWCFPLSQHVRLIGRCYTIWMILWLVPSQHHLSFVVLVWDDMWFAWMELSFCAGDKTAPRLRPEAKWSPIQSSNGWRFHCSKMGERTKLMVTLQDQIFMHFMWFLNLHQLILLAMFPAAWFDHAKHCSHCNSQVFSCLWELCYWAICYRRMGSPAFERIRICIWL